MSIWQPGLVHFADRICRESRVNSSNMPMMLPGVAMGSSAVKALLLSRQRQIRAIALRYFQQSLNTLAILYRIFN